MMVDWVKKMGARTATASVVVVLLVIWNVSLGGSLLLGPGAPQPLDAKVDHRPIAQLSIQSTRELVDMSSAIRRPLFSPDRSIQRTQVEPLTIDEEIVTAVIPSSNAIEFRGVVNRDGVLFAACRTSASDKIGLYQIGDEILDGHVLHISRSELVLERLGKIETHNLALSTEESPTSSVLHHQQRGQVGGLIIGPGAH